MPPTRRSAKKSQSQSHPNTSYSQLSQSQRSKSQSKATLTQTKIEELFPNTTKASNDDSVNDCVRYFVSNSGNNSFFRSSDISKAVGVKFVPEIIEKTTAILKNVYGYNLVYCEAGQAADRSPKGYIITNVLDYVELNKASNLIRDQKKEAKKLILMIVLCHIYMSNGAASEGSLFAFLLSLGIDVNDSHKKFGVVKDHLSAFIKEKFLLTENEALKSITYKWGMRAENEISKTKLLGLVCKIYGDRPPQSFGDQFTAANEQGM